MRTAQGSFVDGQIVAMNGLTIHEIAAGGGGDGVGVVRVGVVKVVIVDDIDVADVGVMHVDVVPVARTAVVPWMKRLTPA
jgi:hypothetical protein